MTSNSFYLQLEKKLLCFFLFFFQTLRWRAKVDFEIGRQSPKLPPDKFLFQIIRLANSPVMIVGNELVESVRDDVFSKIRSNFKVPDDFLFSNFDFENLTEGGGKGRTLLSRSSCGNFFVKELSHSDRKSLLDGDFCERYAERLLSHSSLLCRILTVFVRKNGKFYIGMGNSISIDVKKWDFIYDLKGSADDKTLIKYGQSIDEVHKRFWRLDWIISEAFGKVSKKRIEYVIGKREAYTRPIFLSIPQKKEIMQMLKNDLNLFLEQGLMDYSMIVAVKQIDKMCSAVESTSKFSNMHNSYRVSREGKNYIIYFGIIDFLQGWTTAKKVANVIKIMFAPKPISTIQPIKYAKQFENFFENKFCTDYDIS